MQCQMYKSEEQYLNSSSAAMCSDSGDVGDGEEVVVVVVEREESSAGPVMERLRGCPTDWEGKEGRREADLAKSDP